MLFSFWILVYFTNWPIPAGTVLCVNVCLGWGGWGREEKRRGRERWSGSKEWRCGYSDPSEVTVYVPSTAGVTWHHLLTTACEFCLNLEMLHVGVVFSGASSKQTTLRLENMCCVCQSFLIHSNQSKRHIKCRQNHSKFSLANYF